MNPVPFIGYRGYHPAPTVGYHPRVRRKPPFLANLLATPLNFRVYSRSPTTAVLLWDDVSTTETGVEIERESPVGGGFSNVTTTAVGVVTFEDTGLTASTVYQYRIRTTDGSSTSAYTTVRTSVAVAPSIVTTQACPTTGPFHKELVLPRWSGDSPEESNRLLNELATKIEDQWNTQVAKTPECVVCPTNTGALIIDCSECNNFKVITSEDINSITVEHCAGEPVVLHVVNPNPLGGDPITVCGWPLGFKCVLNGAVLHDDARCCSTVSGGSSKRLGFSCPVSEICLPDDTKEDEEVPSTGGGGGFGEGCGDLRLECEVGEQGSLAFDDSADSAVTCAPLECSASAPRSDFRARCGMPPYTWTITTPLTGGTAPVTTESDTSGIGNNDKIRIEPAGTSTGTNVAFCRKAIEWVACTPGLICGTGGFQAYRCDGTTFSSCLGSGCCCDSSDPGDCANIDPNCFRPGTSGCSPIVVCDEGDGCAESPNSNPFTCDCREQADKDSGTCEPCALNLAGDGTTGTATLTVTDAAGDSVSIAILVEAA